jgi:hypothetical protein
MLLLCLLLQAPAFAMAAEQPAQADIRYVTVHGQVDPRVQVSVLSWYRSTDDDNLDCTRSDWNTGTQKRILTVRGETGLRNQFSVKVPIDFVGKDGCGWDYAGTELKLSRYQDNKNKSYSRYTLLSDRNEGDHTERGYKGGQSNRGLIPGTPKTSKNHYFLGKDLRFECRTIYYGYSEKLKKMLDEDFYCIPQAVQWDRGMDVLQDTTVTIEVVVDESEGSFIEYVPTTGERIKRFFNGLF